MPSFSRRRFLAASGAVAASGCARWSYRAPEDGPIAALFPGRIDDGGIMESGYRGLRRAEREFGLPVMYADGLPSGREALLQALRQFADSEATLVIALGWQAAEAVQRVAWEFPQQRFASVQGPLTRPNLTAYEVLQEQSAWLAGAAAGLLTRSNVVGHVSGSRVPPGLKSRAAFADGLRSTNPGARLLTTFSGSEDDAGVNRQVTLAQIDAGADLVFTMLNGGRSGAIEACRARGVRQIGSVGDWVSAAPDVFVASAFADVGHGVFAAARDLRDNLLRGDIVKRFGVNSPEVVRLVLADGASAAVKQRIAALTAELGTGRIALPDSYTGPEFTV